MFDGLVESSECAPSGRPSTPNAVVSRTSSYSSFDLSVPWMDGVGERVRRDGRSADALDRE